MKDNWRRAYHELADALRVDLRRMRMSGAVEPRHEVRGRLVGPVHMSDADIESVVHRYAATRVEHAINRKNEQEARQ